MKFETISAREIDLYIQDRSCLIIDLRAKEEYQAGHIRGAVHIDFEELDSAVPSLPVKKTLILYCDRGGVSLMAARKLWNMGFNVKSVVGGMHAYTGNNMTGFGSGRRR